VSLATVHQSFKTMKETLKETAMSPIEMVAEFHQKFGHPQSEEINLSDNELIKLRLALIKEEYDELFEACAAKDAVGVLDALSDIEYVLNGTYEALGFSQYKQAALEEVHRSNMSKANTDGTVRRAPITGKILKGDNYSPPNLAKILEGKA
jgi:predicted HAD superfamily Cof-like phosphohydrolase